MSAELDMLIYFNNKKWINVNVIFCVIVKCLCASLQISLNTKTGELDKETYYKKKLTYFLK